jgi:hypothetical protein
LKYEDTISYIIYTAFGDFENGDMLGGTQYFMFLISILVLTLLMLNLLVGILSHELEEVIST